ncbi:MAG: hypothetical protein KKA42_13775 [candidate division Zixibacteria bacterium]|nr:hypothetical protein [candidate division Zixibacteria bacterium]
MTGKTNKIEMVIGLAMGSLAGHEIVVAERLIAKEPELAEVYELARQLLSAKDVRREAEVGHALKNLSSQLFRDYIRNLKGGIPTGITVFDSRDLPVPRGIRRPTVDTRGLRYKLGDLDVELAFYPTTVDSCELIGQVSGLDGPGPLTVTLEGGSEVHTTETDQFHLFRFPRIPVTEYRLILQRNDAVLGTIEISL